MRAIAALPSSGRASATRLPAAAHRYPVKITVFCDDRAGMLKELTAVISDDDTNIRGVDTRHDSRRRSRRGIHRRSRRPAPPEQNGARPPPRGRRPHRPAHPEALIGLRSLLTHPFPTTVILTKSPGRLRKDPHLHLHAFR